MRVIGWVRYNIFSITVLLVEMKISAFVCETPSSSNLTAELNCLNLSLNHARRMGKQDCAGVHLLAHKKAANKSELEKKKS